MPLSTRVNAIPLHCFALYFYFSGFFRATLPFLFLLLLRYKKILLLLSAILFCFPFPLLFPAPHSSTRLNGNAGANEEKCGLGMEASNPTQIV